MATPPKPQSSPPSVADQDSVERLRQATIRLKTEIAKLVVGQDRVIDMLQVCLLCRGHA